MGDGGVCLQSSTQEMGRSLSSRTPWSGQSGQFQANSRPARDNKEALPQRKKRWWLEGEVGDGLVNCAYCSCGFLKSMDHLYYENNLRSQISRAR